MGNLSNALFTSQRDDWETPQKLFDKLNDLYRFTLDPCSTDTNAKCKKHYTIKDDGLAQSWAGERVFCNPPPMAEKSASGLKNAMRSRNEVRT